MNAGVHELKEHPWFEGISWENIHHLPSAYIPQTSRTDTTLFDERQQFFPVHGAKLSDDEDDEEGDSPGSHHDDEEVVFHLSTVS